jgi:hypothetical protein
VQLREILYCVETGLYWLDDLEEPKCADGAHEHRRHEVHVHQERVSFPDGTAVTAVSFDPTGYERTPPPDFGVYLDERWQPPWPHEHVDWPDFGLPSDRASLMATLDSVRERARAGEVIEIGCLGGHGRTGTALACLAVLTGVPAVDAVGWVRANFCEKAVETPEQEAFVSAL